MNESDKLTELTLVFLIKQLPITVIHSLIDNYNYLAFFKNSLL